MGVMACFRKDCNNIMCDTYVDSVGYICYDCKNEFEFFVSAKNKRRTESKLLKWLNEFMETSPNRHVFTDEGITVEEFFKIYER